MEWVCVTAVKHLTEKTNGTLRVEIKYVNTNEDTDSLSSKLFGAENTHIFKQRNLKETQDFGRDFQVTPEEGRYPSPITQHCPSLPVVAVFMLSLFVGTMEAWGMSHTGIPQLLLKDTFFIGQERLT